MNTGEDTRLRGATATKRNIPKDKKAQLCIDDQEKLRRPPGRTSPWRKEIQIFQRIMKQKRSFTNLNLGFSGLNLCFLPDSNIEIRGIIERKKQINKTECVMAQSLGNRGQC